MAEAKKGLGTEFKEFITRGNVVDLAVAVVIGSAFVAVVHAFVTDLITPIVAAIFGKPDFAALVFTIHKSRFLFGDFINIVITFVLTAAAVFFLVVKPLLYLQDRRKRQIAAGTEDAATLSDEAQLLVEIRDLLRTRGGA